MPKPTHEGAPANATEDPWDIKGGDRSAALQLIVTVFPPGEPRPAPVPLIGDSIRVGRRADSDIVLPQTAVTIAPQHAVFRQIDGSWRVVDQSVTGTYHNDRLLRHEASGPLSLGDRIGLGDIVLAVQLINSPWDDLAVPALSAPADPAPTLGLPVPPPIRPAAPAERYATLLDAFMAGAGLTAPPDLDAVAAMRALGESARAIAGMLVELSHRRPASMVRIRHRHPPPSRLNPLRISIDEEATLLTLLGMQRSGHITGTDAAREVCEDLTGDAAISGKYHADIAGILEELSPESLEAPRQTFSRLLQRDALRQRCVTAYAEAMGRYTAATSRSAAAPPVAESQNPAQNA